MGNKVPVSEALGSAEKEPWSLERNSRLLFKNADGHRELRLGGTTITLSVEENESERDAEANG